MSDNVDALGGLVTAGLVADAITPGSGGGGAGVCANCAATLTGRYCSQCGQAGHVNRSMLHVFEEFLHGLTHFDGKAWQTLPLLVFRPGKLTRAYVQGQRASFVPPVALFLLTVFLMFFAFSFLPGPGEADSVQISISREGRVDQARVAAADFAKAKAELMRLRGQLAKVSADPSAGPGDAGVLAGAVAAAEAAVEVRFKRQSRAQRAIDNPGKAGAEPKDDWISQIKKSEASGDFTMKSGFTVLDTQLRHAMQNPELALYKLQQKTYKYSFLLIPLSIPWLWLMFCWRRDVRLYDHAVFTLYSLSFMSLLLIAGVVSTMWGETAQAIVIPAAALSVPVHFFVQLRGAYVLGNKAALWRTVVLLVGALLSLSVFAVAIFALGLFD